MHLLNDEPAPRYVKCVPVHFYEISIDDLSSWMSYRDSPTVEGLYLTRAVYLFPGVQSMLTWWDGELWRTSVPITLDFFTAARMSKAGRKYKHSGAQHRYWRGLLYDPCP